MRDPSKLIVWHRALDYSVAVSNIACGSASEVQGQLALALKHGITGRQQAAQLWREAEEIRRMLTALARKVRERANAQRRRNGDGEAPGPRT